MTAKADKRLLRIHEVAALELVAVALVKIADVLAQIANGPSVCDGCGGRRK